jgi:adenylylsulfate kinase
MKERITIAGDELISAGIVQRTGPVVTPSDTSPHPCALHLVRQREMRVQRPSSIWLTGLSGAGKSTIAIALKSQLREIGQLAFVLDGDELRQSINSDLGFSEVDRHENVRRIAEIAAMFNEAGVIAIVALISPTLAGRAAARAIIGADRFLEVHVSTELAVCEARDPKGLYQKVRAGLISNFTGISADYEIPLAPALSLDTAGASADLCAARLVEMLLLQGERNAT